MIVVGWPALLDWYDVGDELERIGGPRVLGLLVRVDVERARALVEDHVLEHRREAVRRRPDLGLGRRRKTNDLGVAAALEVEDAVGRPAVLVVADERARRVGRERRLTRAREAEEDRDVAGAADVGRAVHRQRFAQRQQIVHHGEDRLLDLARVARAADQDDAPREVHQDERAGARAVALGTALKERRVDDRELGREVGIGAAPA